MTRTWSDNSALVSMQCLRLAATVGVLLTACAATSPNVMDVQTGPDGSAVLNGELRSAQDRLEYRLVLTAGSAVTVDLSASGPVRGTVIFPSGRVEGGPGGQLLNEVVNESGTYRILVRESPMAEAWQGVFRLQIRTHMPH
jgi:hypothetical protein